MLLGIIDENDCIRWKQVEDESKYYLYLEQFPAPLNIYNFQLTFTLIYNSHNTHFQANIFDHLLTSNSILRKGHHA